MSGGSTKITEEVFEIAPEYDFSSGGRAWFYETLMNAALREALGPKPSSRQG